MNGLTFLVRTIPTHVGRTAAAILASSRASDHPHARGENESTRQIMCITPDHPHARGENCIADRWCGSPYGPSPRTWGEPSTDVPAPTVGRTIPTLVGRTQTVDGVRWCESDHPHARGENAMRCLYGSWDCGPSPRTWGELHYSAIGGPACGTIPTHVGRTTCQRARERESADHPHARGENLAKSPSSESQCGPSPRTWGEPTNWYVTITPFRTIPTHVGRTRLASAIV